ncbi:hypothetical protein JYU34_004433 [Plutella xylostella]|uniref:FLYWCH-type domain-containing protein n=1 Tax=Plutella xylostella TaxID=51655 RepID=A0ABQ7QXZ8_PLUXY|nr:hypothetical protein JYU34_004433 [Plutella xylostella]
MGNHRFTLYNHNDAAIKKRWICTKWTSRKCRAAFVTINDEIVKKINEHNHD